MYSLTNAHFQYCLCAGAPPRPPHIGICELCPTNYEKRQNTGHHVHSTRVPLTLTGDLAGIPRHGAMKVFRAFQPPNNPRFQNTKETMGLVRNPKKISILIRADEMIGQRSIIR